MAGDTLIDVYLAELDDRLRRVPDRRSVLDEVADHLWEKVDGLVAVGRTPVEAQRMALTEFGDPDLVGNAFASPAHGGAAVPTTMSRGFGWIATIFGVIWVAAGLVVVTMASGMVGEGVWWTFIIAFQAGFLGLLALAAGVQVRAGSPPLGWVGLALLAVPLALFAVEGELWWFTTAALAGVAVFVFGLGARALLWPLLAMAVLESLAIVDVVVGLEDVGWSFGVAGVVVILNGIALFDAGRRLATETPVDQPDDYATA